ncbi:hypothetical protein LWI29_026886 [Acer saccharum]|uniref:Peptidase C1A papain C-terminal domain-containing protein n=1 Tax=Acer saccharum TaxID=4024 RepID=A0AA39RNI9_ACESA|nr:hypothetical protein LWI29_026886 [Acer saccharum]
MKALANRPLSVAIDASGRDFQFYSGGVFDRHCGTSVDHGAASVGYGSRGSEEFMGTEMGRKGLCKDEDENRKARRVPWNQQNGFLTIQLNRSETTGPAPTFVLGFSACLDHFLVSIPS